MKVVLSYYRKDAGFETQLELGNALGIDRGVVAKWENGLTYPRPPMITKLAKTLNVTEGDIIEAITNAKRPDEEREVS